MQNGKSPRFSFSSIHSPSIKDKSQSCFASRIYSFFQENFPYGAMKIHLKKNAAANGLELKERLQGLTATDVTHSRESKEAILIFHIWPHKYCENPPSQITKHRLLVNSRNKTGISAPSDLHSQVASLCFYPYSSYHFSSFFLLFLHSFLSPL